MADYTPAENVIDSRDVRAAARHQRALGRAPVVLKPNAKQPVGNEWQDRRYTDSEIDAAFPSDANLGVLTGTPSGDLIDVDLDSPVAVRLASHFLPPTPARFGRLTKPNSHWLYVVPGNSGAPEPDRVRSVKFEDIPSGCGVIVEIRADGRMTMVPPSIHPSGEVVVGTTDHPETTDRATLWTAVAHLSVASLLVTQWDRLRAKHHDFTLALAGGLAKSGVPVDDAEYLLRAVLVDVGDPDVESRLRNLRDTYRKYENGEPVTGWTTVGEYLDPKRMVRVRNDWLKAKTTDFSFTDEGNAQRFIQRFGNRVRYCHGLDAWLVWDGSRWKRDGDETVLELGREIGSHLAELADQTGDKKLKSWANTSRGYQRIQSFLKLARSDVRVKITTDRLDQSPWLLNVANGTLNLRTGALQPHDVSDLLTKRIDVSWSRTAPCPLWERFIANVCLGNSDLIAFLQRLLGYALTGSTKEQIVVFLGGHGGNGKSTLTETLLAILGEYAAKLSSATLMRRGDSTATYDLARIPGVRFLALNETSGGGTLNEEFVKDLSGSDTITARAIYGAPISFKPVAKVFIYGNSRPVITGTDDGIWRRILAPPMNARFTGENPTAQEIKDLQILLRSEYAGILRWMLDGCLAWQRDGLNPPDIVLEANRAYRSEMDTLGNWLSERVAVEGRDVSKVVPVTTDDLHRDYVDHLRRSGDTPLGSRKFGQELTTRGFPVTKSNGRKIRIGLGLLEPEGADYLAGPRKLYTARPRAAKEDAA